MTRTSFCFFGARWTSRRATYPPSRSGPSWGEARQSRVAGAEVVDRDSISHLAKPSDPRRQFFDCPSAARSVSSARRASANGRAARPSEEGLVEQNPGRGGSRSGGWSWPSVVRTLPRGGARGGPRPVTAEALGRLQDRRRRPQAFRPSSASAPRRRRPRGSISKRSEGHPEFGARVRARRPPLQSPMLCAVGAELFRRAAREHIDRSRRPGEPCVGEEVLSGRFHQIPERSCCTAAAAVVTSARP